MSTVFALHAPDGFLSAPVALATAIFSVAVLGMALRRSTAELADRHIPLAGMTAAFIFAAQMVNFPVVSGTTGHLLGGALVAVLLGPWVAALVLGTVVLVQALVFADGGITALGYNTLNMALVTAFGGWAAFVAIRRFMPQSASGVAAATGLAGGISVLLSATAFSLEWLVGATAPISFSTVFTAMISTHLLIAVAEGAISAAVISTVLATRPDLVRGAPITLDRQADRQPVAVRTLVIAGLVAAAFIAAVVSQFAATDPDGLEVVAERTGIEAGEELLPAGPLADYGVSFLNNSVAASAVAGLIGVGVTLVIARLLLSSRRRASHTHKETEVHHHGVHHHHLHVPGMSLVHRLAPETKLVAAIAFVVAVALTPRSALLAFGVHAALVGIAAQVTGLSARLMARRLTVIVPFVAFAVFIPIISGGEQVTWGPISLSVDGLWASWNILIKATLGAAVSIIVSATTTVPDLLRGLHRLRVPKQVTAIVAFMFRYLDLVGDQLGRMRTSMVARSHDPRWLWQARPIASSAGTLFVRSYEQGERIHQAMLARGFTGTMPDLPIPGAHVQVKPSPLTALAPVGIAWLTLLLAVTR